MTAEPLGIPLSPSLDSGYARTLQCTLSPVGVSFSARMPLCATASSVKASIITALAHHLQSTGFELPFDNLAVTSHSATSDMCFDSCDIYCVEREASTGKPRAVRALDWQSKVGAAWQQFASSATWFVILRHRGGKGGFGKNLARKGRLYVKAQRRGETNVNLQGLTRNLRGERIDDVPAQRAAGLASHDAVPAAASTPSPEEIRRKEWELTQRREADREAFGRVVQSAVADGFRLWAVHNIQLSGSTVPPDAKTPNPPPTGGDES